MSNGQTPVEFTGKAGEYFGIWIVNLLLSIITLGVYSAWAKVRRKKYFYNNTLIDGVGFDYHARPIAILKGRIIAFVLFVLYSVLSGFSPILGALLALVLFLAIPWIVVRGMTFNARNSSHRGLRFDFDGKYGQAALVFIGYTLLSIITLGLAIPFVSQRTHKFIVSHHKFG
ncbi:YjgN family protein, partial [Methylotenera sp.]